VFVNEAMLIERTPVFWRLLSSTCTALRLSLVPTLNPRKQAGDEQEAGSGHTLDNGLKLTKEKFTESQNGRGWKGPLSVVYSKPPDKA